MKGAVTTGKRLLTFFLCLLVGYAAVELLLPPLVSQVVGRGMTSFTGSSQVTVAVEKRPAFLMLNGEFDKISVTAVNAQTEKLTFADMKIILRDVRLDLPALLAERTVKIKSVGDIDLTAAVAQDELANCLNRNVKGIKNATVAITPEKVQVGSSFAVGGLANVALKIDGRIVSDGSKIKFVTERFLLNNNLVGNLGGALATEVTLADLKKLPFAVGIRSIVLETGRVVIYADNRLAGQP